MPAANMFSFRANPELRRRLDSAASSLGESRSSLIIRLVDEGLKMEVHPGIVFRNGPLGRRPGLPGGPDVWEVMRVVLNVTPSGESAVAAASKWLELPFSQVSAAVNYYVEFQAEIDDWIAKVDLEADRVEEAFLKRAAVLG